MTLRLKASESETNNESTHYQPTTLSVYQIACRAGQHDQPDRICKVIMGDERQGSLTLPRLFMLPSIQSIPVYGFLFHPTKITSWGKNVQEYGVKTIKSVENKYL